MYAVCVGVLCVCCRPVYSGRQTCGRTSRGHTGGRSHRIYPPSFYGACLDFHHEKNSVVSFPRRLYNSIFSTGAAMVLKKSTVTKKVFLPIEIHVALFGLQVTHKLTLLLYFCLFCVPFWRRVLCWLLYCWFLLSIFPVFFSEIVPGLIWFSSVHTAHCTIAAKYSVEQRRITYLQTFIDAEGLGSRRVQKNKKQ